MEEKINEIDYTWITRDHIKEWCIFHKEHCVNIPTLFKLLSGIDTEYVFLSDPSLATALFAKSVKDTTDMGTRKTILYLDSFNEEGFQGLLTVLLYKKGRLSGRKLVLLGTIKIEYVVPGTTEKMIFLRMYDIPFRRETGTSDYLEQVDKISKKLMENVRKNRAEMYEFISSVGLKVFDLEKRTLYFKQIQTEKVLPEPKSPQPSTSYDAAEDISPFDDAIISEFEKSFNSPDKLPDIPPVVVQETPTYFAYFSPLRTPVSKTIGGKGIKKSKCRTRIQFTPLSCDRNDYRSKIPKVDFIDLTASPDLKQRPPPPGLRQRQLLMS